LQNNTAHEFFLRIKKCRGEKKSLLLLTLADSPVDQIFKLGAKKYKRGGYARQVF
jgi:hypothetical protein